MMFVSKYLSDNLLISFFSSLQYVSLMTKRISKFFNLRYLRANLR